MKAIFRVLPLFLLSVAIFSATQLPAQDWLYTGTNLGQGKIRLAAADFKPVGGDPQLPPLKAVFDSTLYNDLSSAGVFDLVSKSLAPQATPGSPQEAVLSQWSADPAKANMVAFGAIAASNGRLQVNGWLFDATSTSNPQEAQQYQRGSIA